MSNLNPLFQDLPFDPEEVTAVNQAYEREDPPSEAAQAQPSLPL
jgi:hypothetical protein